MTGRVAKLVLVTPDGNIVGALPPVPVSTPWWSHAEPVVEAVKEKFGYAVTILRLLEAEKTSPYEDGGNVTYLAEIEKPVLAEHWSGTLDEQPLRQSYAKIGGPKADLAWAKSILADQDYKITDDPVQVRTWNLSSIWRIPTEHETIWMKSVPPFFAHEGRIMAAMQDKPIPQLLAHDQGRVLIREIPGEDMYEADIEDCRRMIDIMIDIQSKWIGHVDELLTMGLPDWREVSMTEKIIDVVNRTADQLDQSEKQTLYRFIDTLPQRFADVAACGMHDTLVHGDFHRGNVRGNDQSLVILDWGDSGIGHPMLDQAAFLERHEENSRIPLKEHWARQWKQRNPSSDPQRAATLLTPIAYARQAHIYHLFMDNIEPAEHVFHRTDPARWLKRAAAHLQQG